MNDDQLRTAFDDLVGTLDDDRVLPAGTRARIQRRRRLKTSGGALGTVGAIAVAVVVVGAQGPGPERLLPPGDRPSPVASSPPVEPTPAPAPARVVLRPDGLGFSAGSSTSLLAFGTDATTARDAVDAALGQGGERPTPDCGEGSSSVQYESLFLLLDDGAFVGWATGSPGPSTADGITVGATLRELRAAVPDVQVSEGSVGAEWTSPGDGGLAGFLDGTLDTSLVTGITAGVRCIAR